MMVAKRLKCVVPQCWLSYVCYYSEKQHHLVNTLHTPPTPFSGLCMLKEISSTLTNPVCCNMLISLHERAGLVSIQKVHHSNNLIWTHFSQWWYVQLPVSGVFTWWNVTCTFWAHGGVIAHLWSDQQIYTWLSGAQLCRLCLTCWEEAWTKALWHVPWWQNRGVY